MAMHDEARRKMAKEDIDLIDQYTNDWNKAYAAGDKAGMDKAHQLAESVRSKYNYTGGDDGSQYQEWAKPKTDGWSVDSSASQTSRTTPQSAGSFSYPAMTAYVDGYQQLIDAAQKKFLNREAFSYDAEKDPSYQQYRDSYTRQGNKAMQDTIAEISARTGGLASSYAGQAAQQTYDGYMSALADKIPELREIAYQKYMDEYNMDRDALNVLTGLSDREYGRYLDDRNQYNTDRNFAYGQFADDRDYAYKLGRDKISDERYENELAHQREQDAYNRAWDEDEREYQRGQDAYNREWKENEREYARQQDALDREEAVRRVSSGGGSYRSSGGSAGQDDVSTLLERMRAAGSEEAAYAILAAQGLNQTQTNQFWDFYKQPDAIQSKAQELLDSGKNGYYVVKWLYDNTDNNTIDRYVRALGLEDIERDYQRKLQGGYTGQAPVYTEK